ncbi:MAG TPA: hypothetical protein VH575_05940 [Gemmataceae bacterium]
MLKAVSVLSAVYRPAREPQQENTGRFQTLAEKSTNIRTPVSSREFLLRCIGSLGERGNQIANGAELGQTHAEAIEEFLQGEVVVQAGFLVVQFIGQVAKELAIAAFELGQGGAAVSSRPIDPITSMPEAAQSVQTMAAQSKAFIRPSDPIDVSPAVAEPPADLAAASSIVPETVIWDTEGDAHP